MNQGNGDGRIENERIPMRPRRNQGNGDGSIEDERMRSDPMEVDLDHEQEPDMVAAVMEATRPLCFRRQGSQLL